jgi:hypothetical protein
MARKITDYNGTVVAVGGAYPYGDIKDNPSGTIIDRKSNADLQQFFQKLADSAGITLNSLADNSTNGFQLTEALSKVIGNHAAQIVVSLIGGAYDPTKVYILWGCATRSDSGFAMYDGELYYIQGNAGSACGGSLVDIVTVFSPVLYTNGVQTLQIACGTSGTGIANFADVIYVNKWKAVTGTVFTGIGGTITVAPTDILLNKYIRTGNTIHYQLWVSEVTISGTFNSFTISLPFLSSNVNITPTQVCGIGNNFAAITCSFSPTLLTIERLDRANFTTGVDDQQFQISVTFEIN